jgi:predicted transcriptional regulator
LPLQFGLQRVRRELRLLSDLHERAVDVLAGDDEPQSPRVLLNQALVDEGLEGLAWKAWRDAAVAYGTEQKRRLVEARV